VVDTQVLAYLTRSKEKRVKFQCKSAKFDIRLLHFISYSKSVKHRLSKSRKQSLSLFYY